jgi:hypothetical protein
MVSCTLLSSYQHKHSYMIKDDAPKRCIACYFLEAISQQSMQAHASKLFGYKYITETQKISTTNIKVPIN